MGVPFSAMPRRGKGEGSITWREDKGLYQGRIELEADPKTGKRRRKTIYAKTRAKLIEKMTKERLKPDAVRTAEIQTVGELMDLFIVHVDNTKAEATRISYRRCLSLVRSSIEKLPLQKLTKARINAVLNAMDSTDAWHAKRVLKTCLRWAVSEEYLDRSPMHGLRSERYAGSRRVKFWTPPEAKKLLSAARGHWLEPMVRLLLSTGIRLGEALGLQWCSVDLDHGSIRIERQLTENKSRQKLAPLKTKKSYRTIKISDDDVAMLRALKNGVGDDAPVFKGPRLSRWLRRSVARNGFDEIIEKAGVPRRTIHATRHTNATALLLAGVPVKVVSERLGHSSVSITWETYAHVLPEQHEGAAEAASKLFQ